MYCSKCGSFLPEGADECPNCHEAAVNQSANRPNYNQNTANNVYYTPHQNNEQPSYFTGQAQTQQQNYYQQNNQNYYSPAPDYMEQEIKNNISSANTLGVLAIVLGILLSPLAGIICGAIGIGKINNLPNISMYPILQNERNKAKKLNTIGIVIPIVLWVAAFVIGIIAMFVFGFSMAGIENFM